MSIINIWSKFDLIQDWLKSNTTLDNLFPWGIWAWKPINVDSWMSLYFWLSDNSPLVESDRKWQKNIKKRAFLEFVITTNKKDIPEVEIYETLDTLSNEIVGGDKVDLSWFIINWIQEWNQTWVLVDTDWNPLLIAQYQFDYKNNY